MSAGTIDLPAGGRPTRAAAATSTVDVAEETGIDALRGRMTTFCESAVDVLEVAAALEFDGIGDQAARVRYGFSDVFALAEHLYYAVPRRPAEPAALPRRWQANRAEHVLHGVLFAVPAVCFPVAAPLLGDTPTLIAYVGATLVSWASSQALAYLGFVRAGRLDRAGSLRILRIGAVAALLGLWSLLAWAIFVVPALGVPVGAGGLLVAGGQGTYLIGATVLLVCGQRHWLLLCLAPGVAAGTAYLVLGQPGGFAVVVWWSLVATILATLVTGGLCTARPGPGGAWLPHGYELRGAISYALFGLAAAGLLSYPVVAGALTGVHSDLAALLATPLCLSMGAAEWCLYWYRGRTDQLLRRTDDTRQFALAARRVLIATTARYLVAAAVLITVMAIIVAVADRRPPRWTTVVDCLAFLALGGALFVGLLLQAFGGDLVTPLACAAAVVVELVVALTTPVPPLAAQLVAGTVLTAALLVHASTVLSRATRHA